MGSAWSGGELLLLVAVVLAAMNLAVAVASWWRHDSLASRVTRIEERQTNALTAAECRAIFERLSNIEGRVNTTNQLIQTIQGYLLERDE